MTAKVPNDDPQDVRGLLAELGELVGDLGLGEGQVKAKPKPRRRSRQVSAAAAARNPVLGAVESPAADGMIRENLAAAEQQNAAAEPARPRLEVVPPAAAGPHRPSSTLPSDDAAELANLAAAISGNDAVPLWETSSDAEEPQQTITLWDAFAEELDAEPPRPWTPAAAMQVVEPAAPPAPPKEPRPTVLHRITEAFRPRLFTIATVAAVVVALAVVVLTRFSFATTSGPARPVAKAAFGVTTMRTVDATAADAVALAPTRSTFPAKATQVYMDVIYKNATQGDTLRLVISLLPPAGSGGNPVQVGDQTHPLPTGGEIAVTIQGPSSGFSPGDYTVTAFHDGHLEQSLSFTISAPAPTPTAAPTPAAAPPAPPGPATTP